MRACFIFVASLLPLLVFSQVTKIYTIQGNGAASPLAPQTITTEGVVYADFQGSDELSGFFIQDTLGDGNATTSDGIFVFSPGGTNVNVGDYVSITAQVQEYLGLTELGNVSNVTVLRTAVDIPVPVQITLPVANLANFEAIEGMYVSFPQTLTVSDHYNLGKYGEITLATERLFIPTNEVDPNDDPASGTSTTGSSNVGAINAMVNLHARSQVLIDDARSASFPNPVPFIDPVTQTLRTGSTVQNIRGAFSFGFSKYRLMPLATPVFTYAARPAVPVVSGDIKVASFNMLNFFATIDNGTNGARGADSPAEYIRQRDKLVATLSALRADIYALIEVENNGTAAADSLVKALNASVGSQDYALATENSFTGTYAIKNVFVYNIHTVTPINSMMTSTNVLFYPPPIAHEFEVNATGARFNLIANHYRYKGCDGASGPDFDQLDGQGCYNDARRQQSMELLDFFEHIALVTGNNDHLIVGDFNSYEQEDPIDVFVRAGYTKMINGSYSYAYMNEFGSLDYVLASPGLSASINDAKIWHINSDEPPALDYNLESVVDDLYQPTPYRSSDHDPVLVGLSPTHMAPLGLDELTDISARVFPNPFDDKLSIYTESATDVKLTDVSGRSLRAISRVEGAYTLNTADLPAGVILVSFYRNGNHIVTKRVVKQ